MRRIAVLVLVVGLGAAAPAVAQPAAVAQPTPAAHRAGPVAAQADPFAGHRRADGTLIWESLVGSDVEPGARLERFSLEFFVKELAKVAKTGDRVRVEEFFHGVLATDFYKNYGMYLIGSTAAEVGYDMAYRAYLRRYLKPGFVNGVLRANITLATGLALAQAVTGEFDGKVFAISMGSLGLSSSLVNAAMSRIPWVTRIRTALAGTGAGRMLRVGGFVYQTAELALIFFVGRVIEGKVYELYDRHQARKVLAAAGRRFIDAVRKGPSEAELEEALAAYDQAWVAYRNFLYKPLFEARSRMIMRLGKLAARSHEEASAVSAARARADRYAGLPLEAFLERREQRRDAALGGEAQTIVDAYLHDFEQGMRAIYLAERRGGLLFGEFAFDGPGEFEADDAEAFADEHHDASPNRLETYDDQHAALAVAARLLQGPAAARVRAVQDQLDRVRQADLRLFRDELGLRLTSPAAPPEPADGVGIAQRIAASVGR